MGLAHFLNAGGANDGRLFLARGESPRPCPIHIHPGEFLAVHIVDGGFPMAVSVSRTGGHECFLEHGRSLDEEISSAVPPAVWRSNGQLDFLLRAASGGFERDRKDGARIHSGQRVEGLAKGEEDAESVRRCILGQWILARRLTSPRRAAVRTGFGRPGPADTRKTHHGLAMIAAKRDAADFAEGEAAATTFRRLAGFYRLFSSLRFTVIGDGERRGAVGAAGRNGHGTRTRLLLGRRIGFVVRLHNRASLQLPVLERSFNRLAPGQPKSKKPKRLICYSDSPLFGSKAPLVQPLSLFRRAGE